MNVKENRKRETVLENRRSVLLLAVDGVFAALGVVLMLLLRFPIIPAAPWMLYDGGDIPAMIGGLAAGPVHGLLILAVICIVQMVTPNSSGLYGLLMHFLASGVLVLLPAIFWKKTKSRPVLIISLIASALLMTAVMIPLNLWITPLFLQVPREQVLQMIVPILLPFNLVKGFINAFASLVIFTGLNGILKRVKL